MPIKIAPLTPFQIEKAKAKQKEYNLQDGRGLALKVKPNGSKLWFYNYYRPISGKRNNMSFGKYPLVTLAGAREMAHDARVLLADGIDPKVHRDSLLIAKKPNTLQSTFEQWFETKKGQNSEETSKKMKQRLDNHLLNALGQFEVNSITAPQVIEVLTPLANQGHLEMVVRICQNFNAIMNHAVNEGVIEKNRFTGISNTFIKPNTTSKATLSSAELPELLSSINFASIKKPTRCLIEFQLHTMSRPCEAAGARWSEINVEEKLWSIPAHRMENKEPHIIPLSNQALSLLATIRAITIVDEFIFPSNLSKSGHMNEETVNTALGRMGFKGRQTGIGLRELASNVLKEQGSFNEDLINAALSYKDKNPVRGTYNRSNYLESRAPMMDWWSQYIEEKSIIGSSIVGLKTIG